MKIKQRFPSILYNYIYMYSSSNFERFKPLQSRLNHLPYHLGHSFPSCRKGGFDHGIVEASSCAQIIWFSEGTSLAQLNVGHATQEVMPCFLDVTTDFAHF